MYDDAGEESNYLWHDRSRRDEWVNSLISDDAINPQKFYFRFFQLAHNLYRWCEGNKLNAKKQIYFFMMKKFFPISRLVNPQIVGSLKLLMLTTLIFKKEPVIMINSKVGGQMRVLLIH